MHEFIEKQLAERRNGLLAIEPGVRGEIEEHELGSGGRYGGRRQLCPPVRQINIARAGIASGLALAPRRTNGNKAGMMAPSAEMDTIAWTGGCQCGAVRYKIDAKPHVTVCHCRMCQKAVGGPFAVLAAVAGTAVTWTRGAPARFRSSNSGERLFCSACGTPLAFADLEDGGIELMVGSLDEPIKMAPVSAAGTESYLSWVDRVPDLPGRSTEASVSAAGQHPPISYQHPDHDTPADWLVRASSSDTK